MCSIKLEQTNKTTQTRREKTQIIYNNKINICNLKNMQRRCIDIALPMISYLAPNTTFFTCDRRHGVVASYGRSLDFIYDRKNNSLLIDLLHTQRHLNRYMWFLSIFYKEMNLLGRYYVNAFQRNR